jgi:hypothetical protein
MSQRRWSKQRVIAEIQAQQHMGLAWKSVVRRDCALVVAGRRYFGNWGKAVLAAGFSPEGSSRWTRERVLEAIRQWDWGGRSLSSKRIPKAVSTAAYRCFGTWAEAVAAAGLDVCQSRTFQRWTKQGILQAIQAGHQQGAALTRAANPALADAAARYFGSWTEALVAAGVPRTPRKKWSERQVLEELQALHRQGQFEETTTIADTRLARAASRRFGGWRQALVAAGVLAPGESLRPKLKWPVQRVIEEIQDRYVRGLPPLSTKEPLLLAAANRHFGSWGAAKRAAGVPMGEKINRLRRWTPQRLLQALRTGQESGQAVSQAALRGAARRYFGSWSRALSAARVAYKPRRQWTKQRVFEELRDGFQRGASLTSLGNYALHSAAKRYYGSWHRALRAAGWKGLRKVHQKKHR